MQKKKLAIPINAMEVTGAEEVIEQIIFVLYKI